MIYASVSILASYVLGRDVTVEQMHEAVWPLLLVHHLAAIALCFGCIIIGESVPKDLVCAALLAMLGLTSSLHYVGQILDFSPFAQANAPHSVVQPRVLPGLADSLSGNIYWIRICYFLSMFFLSGNSRRGRCRNSRVDSHPAHPLQC
jgi:hypothetical protein